MPTSVNMTVTGVYLKLPGTGARLNLERTGFYRFLRNRAAILEKMLEYRDMSSTATPVGRLLRRPCST